MASEEISQRFGDSALLQWIPGRIGLPENVRIDHLARIRGVEPPISE
jgi:ribonuclease HI